MTGLLTLLLTGLAIALAAATAYALWQMTHPPRRTYAYALAKSLPDNPAAVPPADGGPFTFESWSFRSRGLELHVWDLRGDLPPSPIAPILILTHGWGESRIHSLTRAAALRHLFSRLILWDLPAHGDSPGLCHLGAQEPDDLLQLLQALKPEAPIILLGSSLGAGVSIAAAARRTVAGVIAEAPYRLPITPARNVMRFAGYPYRVSLPLALGLLGLAFGHRLTWLNRAPAFDRAALAAKLAAPLLVIVGDQDAICPLQDSREIAAAATAGTLAIIPDGHHLNLWQDPLLRTRVVATITTWLQSI